MNALADDRRLTTPLRHLLLADRRVKLFGALSIWLDHPNQDRGDNSDDEKVIAATRTRFIAPPLYG